MSWHVNKGVITLQKKCNRHDEKGLGDFRSITLLNKELKVLANVLINRLQVFDGDLMRTEKNYAMKGSSIYNNLLLVHKILKRIKDDTEIALINMEQSKVFDTMKYWFLVTVLETNWFKSKFSGWMSILYKILSADKGEAYGIFLDQTVGSEDLPFVLFSQCNHFGAAVQQT